MLRDAIPVLFFNPPSPGGDSPVRFIFLWRCLDGAFLPPPNLGAFGLLPPPKISVFSAVSVSILPWGRFPPTIRLFARREDVFAFSDL